MRSTQGERVQYWVRGIGENKYRSVTRAMYTEIVEVFHIDSIYFPTESRNYKGKLFASVREKKPTE